VEKCESIVNFKVWLHVLVFLIFMFFQFLFDMYFVLCGYIYSVCFNAFDMLFTFIIYFLMVDMFHVCFDMCLGFFTCVRHLF
jgi:hypothetical protein